MILASGPVEGLVAGREVILVHLEGDATQLRLVLELDDESAPLVVIPRSALAPELAALLDAPSREAAA